MSDRRRVGGTGSATRAAILDATQALMTDEGYAAVTVRRVAERAAVKPALVQYYFPTMDALLLTLYRRAAERSIEDQVVALASSRPLHALWTLSSDAKHAALAVEFMALANHRAAIKAEIGLYSDRSRRLQIDALTKILGGTHNTSSAFSPIGVSLLLAGAARGLVMEEGLGIVAGHADARAIVARWLDEIEPVA